MVSFAAPPGAMPPPPTPLPKRPTMSLKRDSSYLDTDDEAGLSTTTKRLKVTFNDHPDIHVIQDWNDKSFELVKEEVRIGIQRHLAPDDKRDDAQYAKLLQTLGQDVFSGDAPGTILLKKYVMALDGKVTNLGECGKLVMAVLDLSWLGRDEEFIDVYTKFLVVLGSTHGKYIAPMMERLVSHFERLPASTGRLPGEEIVTRAAMFERLHATIRTILRRIPSASSVLLRMMKHQFPNDLSTTKSYLQYQRHVLRIADAVPELKSEIIALIVQRLVSIDVQIQHDLEDLEEDQEDALLQRPQTSDANAENEDEDDSDLDSVSESEMTTTEEEQQLRDLRLKVAKMDGTQDLLFEYYEPSFTAESTPQKNVAYQELLSQFKSFIMPNRSRHAQFLLFHFAQISPVYAAHFIQQCLSLTVDQNVPNTTRLTACAYVASFIARASHLPPDVIRTVVGALCSFLDEMRVRYEPNCNGPDRKSYSVYYAVAQALLYIFCFRWRDLVVGRTSPQSPGERMIEEDVVAEGHDLIWYPALKETLTRNIHSKLNPLKVCSAAIVGEFAKIANHLKFLYVFSILEHNKRVRLGQFRSYQRNGTVDIGRRETAWDRKSGDAHHQLEAYFPFDPYHLPLSKRWLEGEYNEWELPRGMKRDEEDEDSESEEEYDSDDDEDIPEDLTGGPVHSGLHPSSAISVSD
ncbi:hypothetical protein PRZ48_009544 [Zasmidium cellare]|uniref:RNA polymerase I-specific transcription initiation factor RRN3 n=1 Tax=Zasmidium cellare TaxID=395010 RepID=A0ABR0EC29_ZASCE|nr:hypothetical protein PRZ48_009544 [Zasmidium cellare]